MAKIAAGHPLIFDPTFDVLGPRVDLRETSTQVNGSPVLKTGVFKDKTQSITAGENVSAPGKSFFVNTGQTSIPGRVELGSDSLFELKNDLGFLDGQNPPLEPYLTQAQRKDNIENPLLVTAKGGTDQIKNEDTGQLPVKLNLGFDVQTIQRAAGEPALIRSVASTVPTSSFLPKFPFPAAAPTGIHLDLLA